MGMSCTRFDWRWFHN